MAEELTNEQKQEAVARLFGTIGNHQSEKLRMNLDKAVKIFQSLVVVASDKHAKWFKFVYPNFESWQENPSEPLERADEVTFDGDDFDMLFFNEGAFFAIVVNKLEEIGAWDMNAKRLEFYEATGQTEKLEALQKQIEGENE